MYLTDLIFNNSLYPLNRQKIVKVYKNLLGSFFYNPFTPQMIEKKILFVHIPKTGGTSVATALIGKPTGHPYLYEFYNVNKKYSKNFFKFCIVRNPFDRLVSAYTHIAERECNIEFKVLFKRLDIQSFNDLIDCMSNSKKLQIIQNSCVHFRSQYELIEHCKIRMDVIYKFEEFEKIEDDLFNRIGEHIKINKLNSSKRLNYKSYYNARSKFIIESIYKKDLELFNYTF